MALLTRARPNFPHSTAWHDHIKEKGQFQLEERGSFAWSVLTGEKQSTELRACTCPFSLKQARGLALTKWGLSKQFQKVGVYSVGVRESEL